MKKPAKVELMARRNLYRGYLGVDGLRLRHEQFAGGLGPELKREVVERGHAVAVLPYDPALDLVVLIEQFRAGPFVAGDPEPWLVEIIAGIVEDGEAAEEVAVRESAEEAGLEVTALERIAGFYSSPGVLSEQVELYCGRVDAGGAGGLHGLDHEGEDIRVLVPAFDEAMAMLAEGRIRFAPALVALQWLALNREALRRRWA
jgi:ADP-ribose pyrophosphatase